MVFPKQQTQPSTYCISARHEVGDHLPAHPHEAAPRDDDGQQLARALDRAHALDMVPADQQLGGEDQPYERREAEPEAVQMDLAIVVRAVGVIEVVHAEGQLQQPHEAGLVNRGGHDGEDEDQEEDARYDGDRGEGHFEEGAEPVV